MLFIFVLKINKIIHKVVLNPQHIILLQQSFALLSKIPPAEMKVAFRNKLAQFTSEPYNIYSRDGEMPRKLMFRLAYVVPRLNEWDVMREDIAEIFTMDTMTRNNCVWCAAWIGMSEQLLSSNWNLAVNEAWTAFFTILLGVDINHIHQSQYPKPFIIYPQY